MSSVDCMTAQAAFVREVLEPLGYTITGDGSDERYWAEKDGRRARILFQGGTPSISAAASLAHTVGLMFGSEPWIKSA